MRDGHVVMPLPLPANPTRQHDHHRRWGCVMGADGRRFVVASPLQAAVCAPDDVALLVQMCASYVAGSAEQQERLRRMHGGDQGDDEDDEPSVAPFQWSVGGEGGGEVGRRGRAR